ncbi:hypothetical protein FPQ18DRAFT_305394 [Pyronema domesticum]|uniref:Uncharacterized protein n=1 Tax=Pyronema omphalodes (strain CBS 100304) TaxID=1076935 RepID=U4LH86_PYROM|nr:hypothetical protein FPQ18DRAFT_305394 [Pyronema domesticum]CCX30877.1 Protein of unknown function [Pyronema omphalodes CBS 100304]
MRVSTSLLFLSSATAVAGLAAPVPTPTAARTAEELYYDQLQCPNCGFLNWDPSMSNVTNTEPPVSDVTLDVSPSTEAEFQALKEKLKALGLEGQDFNEITTTSDFESGVNNIGIKIVGAALAAVATVAFAL